MDAADLLDSVREQERTPLSRLGSSKALYALTGGEMDDATVRAAAADVAHHASETFADWEGDVEADAASIAGEHRDEADAGHAPGEPNAMYDVLSALDGETARLGGLLGWTLVAEKFAAQTTGYFTGQADPGTASTFRSQGSDLEDLQERILDALADHDDREAAEDAARAVIEAAYDEYFETLESMGVNPKPVC